MKPTDSTLRKWYECLLIIIGFSGLLAVLSLVDLNDRRWENPIPEIKVSKDTETTEATELTNEQMVLLAGLHNPLSQ